METITHRCPNCGGPLLFDPEKQDFHCEYCQSVFTIEEIEQFEQRNQTNTNSTDDSVAVEKTNDSAESNIQPVTEDSSNDDHDDESLEWFSCPSCGAELVTDGTTAATFCYYCHNPVVLTGRLSGKFLPEKVVPFTIEKKKAVDVFLAWAKKKRFIPKDFFDESQIEKLTGVYFPYWLVDSEVDGEMDAKGNKLRVWRVGDIEYTETKQYGIIRKGTIAFRDLMKNALSKNISQEMIHSIQPFNLSKATDFSSHYLSGFQAEKRDLEYKDLTESIHQELTHYSEQMLRETVIGYTNIYQVKNQISIVAERSHYVLLPVWLVTYRKRNDSEKVYYYAMNGQTGKVSGVLPINYWKLSGAAIGIGILVALIVLLGGYFL